MIIKNLIKQNETLIVGLRERETGKGDDVGKKSDQIILSDYRAIHQKSS